MKILGIDSTGNVASAAIVEDHITMGEISTNYQKNHSVTLMPMIAELLERLEARLSDMDYIACASGPGSFTGLRIGAATAKALAHGAGKKIVPVPTLDGLAYNVYSAGHTIVPIMDARRGQVYTAFYRRESSGLVRLTDYMAEDIETVLALLKAYEPPIFLGDGVAAHRSRLELEGCDTAPAHINMQRAAAIAALAAVQTNTAVSYNGFQPFYLRKPQAERERDERLTVEKKACFKGC